MPKLYVTNLEASIVVCKAHRLNSPDDVIIERPIDEDNTPILEDWNNGQKISAIRKFRDLYKTDLITAKKILEQRGFFSSHNSKE